VWPSDGEPAHVPALRAQRATSFVVQTTSLVGSASHVQCLPESAVNYDDRLDERSPTQRDTRWHNSYDQGVIGRVCARHFSSPWGVRQRLTAWQLTGRLSNARDILACAASRRDGRENRHPTNSLGPASGLGAVLGRDALGWPGDCIEPDAVHVMYCRRNVKQPWDLLLHKCVIQMFHTVLCLIHMFLQTWRVCPCPAGMAMAPRDDPMPLCRDAEANPGCAAAVGRVRSQPDLSAMSLSRQLLRRLIS